MPILEIYWKRASLIQILSFFEMLLSPGGDIIKVTLSKPEQLDFAYGMYICLQLHLPSHTWLQPICHSAKDCMVQISYPDHTHTLVIQQYQFDNCHSSTSYHVILWFVTVWITIILMVACICHLIFSATTHYFFQKNIVLRIWRITQYFLKK